MVKRRGRKLKKGVRAPRGRLSEAKAYATPREDVRKLVWDQRRQHLGLTGGRERSAFATSFYGWLLETEQISKDVYRICEHYAATQARYTASTGAPRLTNGARCYGEMTGGLGTENEERDRTALQAFGDVVRLFEGCPALHIAVRGVAIKGIAPERGDVRGWDQFYRGIEMLAQHWGMPFERRQE